MNCAVTAYIAHVFESNAFFQFFNNLLKCMKLLTAKVLSCLPEKFTQIKSKLFVSFL